MSSSKNLEYKKTAFLSKSNNAFIEEMYMKFIKNDPNNPAGVTRNPNNLGNAWFVDEIRNVKNSNQEKAM